MFSEKTFLKAKRLLPARKQISRKDLDERDSSSCHQL